MTLMNYITPDRQPPNQLLLRRPTALLLGTNLTATFPIPQNIWTHIVGTYDGGTALQLYVNGIPNNSATLAQVANTVLGGSLDIGRYTGTWGYFNGSIDDVRIYN